MTEPTYTWIDPMDASIYQSIFHLKRHEIPTHFRDGKLIVKESTPEVEAMLDSLFDGMTPKHIHLPEGVTMDEYYTAKALIARCEGEE